MVGKCSTTFGCEFTKKFPSRACRLRVVLPYELGKKNKKKNKSKQATGYRQKILASAEPTVCLFDHIFDPKKPNQMIQNVKESNQLKKLTRRNKIWLFRRTAAIRV